MLPPRVFVRSQQPKSIRWRRLRPPRREGEAGVDELRLEKNVKSKPRSLALLKFILHCTDPNDKFRISHQS